MAVITKIRNYSGLLIAVIGIGLAAFVLGDFLGYGPMRQQRFDVGRVEGTSIPFQHFEHRVSQQIDNWQAQTGVTSVGAREAFQFRQQVWNEMVREILLEEEFERLGLNVTAEELYDMIHGADPHPILVQSFTDPATGTYDPQQVIEFLRNFDRLDPNIRNQWVMLEQYMKEERREAKYHQLIGSSYIIPSAMAARDFKNRNTTADIRFVFKHHSDIPDSEVSVSDRELRRVYDENKHRFKQEASRGLKYVSLTVFPSDEDRENTLREITQLKNELAETENIQSFINSVSDQRFDPSYRPQGTLSPQIDPEIFDVPVGTIIGPYMEDNAYVVAKLVDAQMRPDSMRASHILIAYQGSMASGAETTLSRDEASQKADSILNVVRRNPGRFGALAVEFSADPTAAMNDGDLEWFRDGDMVAPFNEAVVEAATNSFLTVETDFGFHVVHVTGKSPLTKKVQVAKLTRNIEPGNRTFQEAYARISGFANELRNRKDFNAAAEAADLNVREAQRVGQMDLTLPGVDNGRRIIQWAFDEDTRTGNFSRIFELDDTFVVAQITNKRDEGIPSLDEIRGQIMAIAMQEKKMELIAQQMEEALAGGSLENLSSQLGLELLEAYDVTFTTTSLPEAGPEPRVIGKVAAMQEGEIKGPIKGNNGVFIVEVVWKSESVVPDDLTQVRRTMQNAFRNRVPAQAFQAIRANARIEDNRVMFF